MIVNKNYKRFKNYKNFNKYSYKNKIKKYNIKKKPITDVIITITETLNNLFITISKINGLVIGKSSSGHMKLQKKKIPLVAEILGNYIGKKVIEKGFKSYTLIITGIISKLVKSAIRGLKKNYIICKSIKMKHNLTHNGVRLPIAKRK